MKKIIMTLLSGMLLAGTASAQDVIRLGIIGLDTSHSAAFTKLLNSDEDNPLVQKYEIVAAYPYGSRVIESSYKRIPKYIEEVKGYGVEVVDSIQEVLDKVDCVLLETNDGHPHLEQAAEIFKSGKPCFIDKPLAATLGEVLALCELAKRYNVPVFSSSALRFSKNTAAIRNGEYGKILGADCYSPHHQEPTHPDFGFYGIHGIESLFAVMGTGCKEVSRVHSEMGDVVTGAWEDGRMGTFRALTVKPSIYGGTAFTEKGTVAVGGYEGYFCLLEQVLKFFETGVPPIEVEETVEMFAFMKASNMSLAKGGKTVTLEEAYKAGWKDAKKLLKQYK